MVLLDAKEVADITSKRERGPRGGIDGQRELETKYFLDFGSFQALLLNSSLACQ